MLTTAHHRRPSITAAALLITSCFLIAPSPSAAQGCPGATDIPDTPAKLQTATTAITCLVNVERTTRGLRALTDDRDLAKAARGHSRDMIRRDYFDHTSPSGKTVGDRISDAGYGKPGDGWKVGENLGWGTGDRSTPSALVAAWLASPPHRRNMLSSAYKEIGVGVAQGAPHKDASLPGATYTLELGVIR